MPRALMQIMDVHNPTTNQSMAGVECAMMSFVVATNPLGSIDNQQSCFVLFLFWHATQFNKKGRFGAEGV